MYDYEKSKKSGELSNRVYNLCHVVVLLWGFGLNVFMCTFCKEIFMSWNLQTIVIVCTVLTLLGIGISNFSSNPVISFIGYNFVIITGGIGLSISGSEFNMNALLKTIIVTIIIIFLISIYPNILLTIGKVLFIALIGAIVVKLIYMFIGIATPFLWNSGVAIIGCWYIIYDWAKAQKKTHTIDNAVTNMVYVYIYSIIIFLCFIMR